MRSSQRGFTLLELIIAMSLTGLVLVMLYSGFDVGIKSWERGAERASRTESIRLSQEFLRRQLRQSVTVFRNDERDGRVLYFTGEKDRIGWVAPMLRYLGLGGLYYIELDRVGDGDDGQLRLRWHPYRPLDEEGLIDDETAGQTLLIEGVGDLTMEYFGAEEPGDDPDWYDEWENPQQRPELIRLNLELLDGEYPELVVAVLN